MDKDSKFTRDEDGYVAVRTVSAPYSSGSDDKDSMFTRDEDGYVAVRVTGSGGGSGGDQHNLGYYETPEALRTAHPTATAGDFAIVNSTDTVWLWDTDTSSWKDGDTKGQVTSVNNQTGAVTITGADILPTQTDNAGKFLVTNGTSASWDTSVKQLRIKASSTIYCDFFVVSPTGGGTGIYFNSGSGQNVQLGGNFVGGLSFISKLYVREIYYGSNNSQGITVPAVGGTLALQIATLPTAGSTYEGTIYQYTGATDSTYTNGHFYKCVSDGHTPATYSWEEISFGGGNYLSNTATGTNSLTLLGNATASANAVNIGKNSTGDASCVAVGYSAEAKHMDGCVAIGKDSLAKGRRSIAIGTESRADGEGTIAMGRGWVQSANTIQLDATDGAGLSALNEQYTMHVVLRQGVRLKLIDTDGTIPTARLTKVNSTITIAVADWNGGTTATKSVTGITTTGIVFVSPDPTDQSAYTSAGIICSAQAAGTLTFTATSTPSADIDVNVVML